jgi:hypothetical protein
VIYVSDRLIAEKVAEHLGLFDEVMAGWRATGKPLYPPQVSVMRW